MFKNKINYNLVNVLLLAGIIYIVVMLRPYWSGIIFKVFGIILPFLLAFILAYILNPFVKRLENRGVRRPLALGTVIIVFFVLLTLLLWLTLPAIYDQLVAFSKSMTTAMTDLSKRLDLDLGSYQEAITDTLNGIIKNVGSSISTGTIDILGKSVNFLTNAIIVLIVGVYLLIDMDKIRAFIKKVLSKHKKGYDYVKALDHQMGNYLHGLAIYILVQMVEYCTVFYLVGHPSWLLLGILAAITTVIPYFGGIFVNIIALLTASAISTNLFIATLIITLICPNIDGYVISPHIYGKTNNINPLLVIFTAAVCSSFFGIVGIIIGLHLYLIIRTTWEFFHKDIKDYIVDKKEMKKSKS